MIQNLTSCVIRIYAGNNSEEIRLEPLEKNEFKGLQSKITGIHILKDNKWLACNSKQGPGVDYSSNKSYIIYESVDKRYDLIYDGEGENCLFGFTTDGCNPVLEIQIPEGDKFVSAFDKKNPVNENLRRIYCVYKADKKTFPAFLEHYTRKQFIENNASTYEEDLPKYWTGKPTGDYTVYVANLRRVELAGYYCMYDNFFKILNRKEPEKAKTVAHLRVCNTEFSHWFYFTDKKKDFLVLKQTFLKNQIGKIKAGKPEGNSSDRINKILKTWDQDGTYLYNLLPDIECAITNDDKEVAFIDFGAINLVNFNKVGQTMNRETGAMVGKSKLSEEFTEYQQIISKA